MRKAKAISLILGVTIMSFIVGCLVLAWTEPSQAPPGGNVAAPLNVGSTAQTKTGSLSFPIFYDSDNSTYYVNPAGTTVLSGNVGIGATSPGYKLDVSGGDINVSGVYRKGGTAGISNSCSSGQIFSGLTVSGGIITSAGTCTSFSGGSGTVTSISQSNGIILSPNPITTTGSVSLNTTSISTCTSGTTSKIIWDSTNNRLNCATDQTGAGGGGTVTSISQGDGITLSSDPITTTGTVSLNTTAISGCTTGASKIIWDSTNKRLNCSTDQTGGTGTVTSVGAGVGLFGSPDPITTSGSIELDISLISTCTSDSNSKIIWDSSSYKLKCATDQTGGGLTGSGTTNYVTKWTGSTSLGNSQIYDDGTNVGVGLTSPSVKLDVNGAIMPRTYLDMYNAASGIRDWNGSYGSSGQVLTKGSSGVVWGSASGGTLNCTWVGTTGCYGTTCDADCPSGYLRTGCGGGVVTNAAAWRFLLRTNGCRVMADGTRDLEVYAICCKIQ